MMSETSASPATTTTSPATHISRKAVLMKRKMQLRKSLAAKARGGGKVASMVQKLQKQHIEEEKAVCDNDLSEDHKKDGAGGTISLSSLNSSHQSEQPPPPPPPPRLTETKSEPSLNAQSISSSMKQGGVQPSSSFQSETTSNASLSTSQTASTHSTHTTPSTLTRSVGASRNTVISEVQAKDIEELQSEKNDLHKKLQAYEADFVATHGREVELYQDLEPVAQLYKRYLVVKKEVARRGKKKVSVKSAAKARSSKRRNSSEGEPQSPMLDKICEVSPDQEETTEECSRGLEGFEQSERVGNNADTNAVVAAVAAILQHDKRHKVEDPGYHVQIPGEENDSFCNVADKKDDDSIDSEPGRIVPTSTAQPFDEISQGDEIISPSQPRRQQRGGGSNESTPERSNKAKGRRALAYNKGSPAGVASLSAEETPQRLGARPVRTMSVDDELPTPEGPPQILSVVSSASSSGIVHLSEAGSQAPPISYRSSSRTVPISIPWTSCLVDDASNLSAQFTTSLGSADEYDNDTYCTPAIVRIRQTATCSRNVPRSNTRSISDVLTCKPRDEDIRSIDSGGPPGVCKAGVCTAATTGAKANPYTSKPMPIDEANSFIVNMQDKKIVPREDEQLTDITFPSFPEEETWSSIDDMMKTLEQDVASAKETISSLPDHSHNSDQSGSAVTDKLTAHAAASSLNLNLVMEELDSLKAEFDSISKELTLSNDRLKQLEVDIEERDQTIATLRLERDLAQADVKHLQDKLGRLEEEMKATNASNRKKMKTKDAQIALLNNTIEKLRQELDAAKDRVPKSDNRNQDVLPTFSSSEEKNKKRVILERIIPNPSRIPTSKDRSPSPLHPDDESEDDLYNCKCNDEPTAIDELSLLSTPPRTDQKARATDICRKKERIVSESPNSMQLSQSSSSLEEALAFVRSFSANKVTEDILEDSDTKDNSTVEDGMVEEKSTEAEQGLSREENGSIQLVEAPSEEMNQDIVASAEENSKIRNECADLATEFCCVQEASDFINNIHEDWRNERAD